MQPFSVPPGLEKLRYPYPEARELSRRCASENGKATRLAVARLWLSEGVPFAFRESPGLWEQVRVWLSSRLDVDPKEITLVGSARLGQSLDPKRLGEPFTADSDLDLTTVSSSLFERLAREFNLWAENYKASVVLPRNQREHRFWRDNLERGPGLIGRGFMNSKFVPLREPYRCAQLIGQTMFLLREKLRLSPGAPTVRTADVRAYRDWGAYARQMAISLQTRSRGQDSA